MGLLEISKSLRFDRIYIVPWKVEKSGNKWLIKKKTGKVVGHSTSKSKAAASVRARYANYKG